jgi:hypothetical protein
VAHAHRRRIVGDHLGLEGREHDQLLAGAGDRDVEAALAAVAVERPEVHRHRPRRIGAVAHREQDDVALVALDRLQVLDQHWLRVLRCERRVERRVGAPRLIEQILDQALLGAAEGDDADRVPGPRRIAQAPHHLGDHGLGLGAVGAGTGPVVDAVDLAPLDAELGDPRRRRREHLQAIAVVAAVRERDEIVVAAAVVPAQAQLGQARRDAGVEDALEVAGQRILVVVLVVGHAAAGGKKTGRRQLARVADHHRDVTAGERTDRVGGRDLRRLVEDDQIELRQRRVQVLGDRQRAHQQARGQPRQQRRDVAEQRAQRPVAALLLQLVQQHADLARRVAPTAGGRRDPGHPLGQLRDHARPRHRQVAAVEVRELGDPRVVGCAVESGQRRRRRDAALGPRQQRGALPGRRHRRRLDRARLAGDHRRLEAELDRGPPRPHVRGPVAQRRHRRLPARRRGPHRRQRRVAEAPGVDAGDLLQPALRRPPALGSRAAAGEHRRIAVGRAHRRDQRSPRRLARRRLGAARRRHGDLDRGAQLARPRQRVVDGAQISAQRRRGVARGQRTQPPLRRLARAVEGAAHRELVDRRLEIVGDRGVGGQRATGQRAPDLGPRPAQREPAPQEEARAPAPEARGQPGQVEAVERVAPAARQPLDQRLVPARQHHPGRDVGGRPVGAAAGQPGLDQRDAAVGAVGRIARRLRAGDQLGARSRRARRRRRQRGCRVELCPAGHLEAGHQPLPGRDLLVERDRRRLGLDHHRGDRVGGRQLPVDQRRLAPRMLGERCHPVGGLGPATERVLLRREVAAGAHRVGGQPRGVAQLDQAAERLVHAAPGVAGRQRRRLVQRVHVAVHGVAGGRQPVVAAAVGARPPRPLEDAAQGLDHRLLLRLVRVQLETEVAEAGRRQPALHDLERRHLFGDEQDGLAAGQALRDQVGDRLRLAGARRALQDEALAGLCGQHGGQLRGVAVERREQLGHRDRVDVAGSGQRPLIGERLAAVAGQVAHHRRFEEVLGAGRQVGPHDELGEREDAERRAALDRPADLAGHRGGDRRRDRGDVEAIVVGLGGLDRQVGLGRRRRQVDGDAEVEPQLLEQGLVEARRLVGRHQLVAGAGAAQLDGAQGQRRPPRRIVGRRARLAPDQEAEPDPQRVGAALLEALAGGAVERDQPALELAAGHRREQPAIGQRLLGRALGGLGGALVADGGQRVGDDRQLGALAEDVVERDRVDAGQRDEPRAVPGVEQPVAQGQVEERALPAVDSLLGALLGSLGRLGSHRVRDEALATARRGRGRVLVGHRRNVRQDADDAARRAVAGITPRRSRYRSLPRMMSSTSAPSISNSPGNTTCSW